MQCKSMSSHLLTGLRPVTSCTATTCVQGKSTVAVPLRWVAQVQFELGFLAEAIDFQRSSGPSWLFLAKLISEARVITKNSSCGQMEQRLVNSGRWFSELPADVLVLVVSQLSTRDQLALFSTCTHLRASERALAGALWHDLLLKLAQPDRVGQLAAWLADRKQHLARLTLTNTIPSGASALATSDLCQHTALLLGSLTGSTVSSLSLESGRDAHVGGWLRMLPCLQSLTVVAVRAVVSPSLAQATGLTFLKLSRKDLCDNHPSEDVALPAGCLPPHLVRLEVSGFSSATFWQAVPVGGLQRLQALCLNQPTDSYSSGFFDGLGGHRQLTHLSMELGPLKAVPWQLSSLSELQELSLSGGEMEDNNTALLPLARLRKLSQLKLAHNMLTAVPAALVGLRSLKDLDLSNNYLDGLPAILLRSTSLTRLDIDVGVALALAPELSRLSSLKMLRIADPEWGECLCDGQQVGSILRGLMGVPGFALLDVKEVYGEPDPFTIARELLPEMGMPIPFNIVTHADL